MEIYKPISVELEHRIKVAGLHTGTQKTYLREIRRFSDWLSHQVGKCISPAEALQHAQDYIDGRMAAGNSSYTIHTSAAAICKALSPEIIDCGIAVPMHFLKYPKRSISIKGRDIGTGRNDRTPGNTRVVKLAEKLGIRAHEYAGLKGKDLIQHDGYLWVVVQKGKGGKYQEQLVHRSCEDTVREIFAGVDPEGSLFSTSEIRACVHANLHAIRREHAQECYKEYTTYTVIERERLEQILHTRFLHKFDKKVKKGFLTETEGYNLGNTAWYKEYVGKSPVYQCRGIIKDTLLADDRPIEYDRLSLLATSVFDLSHYRCDVTVAHYML